MPAPTEPRRRAVPACAPAPERAALVRTLLLSFLLVFGGAAAASAGPGSGALEEVVASGSASATTGLRRRQLTRRFDALRRTRHRRPAPRLRPGHGATARGRGVAASVRGPPGR